MQSSTKTETRLGHGVRHDSARPMVTVKDKKGEWWLCDKGVDESRDLAQQDCWRYGDLAFTRED